MNKMLLSLLVLLVAAMQSGAQVLVSYDFETNVNTPSSTDDGLVAGNFLLSSGTISYSTGSSGRAIAGTGWGGADGDKYWEFTLTALAGVVYDLNELRFDYRSTATGPLNYSVRINGAAAGSGTFSQDLTFHSEIVPLTSFSGLSLAQVRISGFNGSGGNGTWRMDNVSLSGLTVVPIPEPSTLALFGGGLIFLAARLRRRK